MRLPLEHFENKSVQAMDAIGTSTVPIAYDRRYSESATDSFSPGGPPPSEVRPEVEALYLLPIEVEIPRGPESTHRIKAPPPSATAGTSATEIQWDSDRLRLELSGSDGGRKYWDLTQVEEEPHANCDEVVLVVTKEVEASETARPVRTIQPHHLYLTRSYIFWAIRVARPRSASVLQ